MFGGTEGRIIAYEEEREASAAKLAAWTKWADEVAYQVGRAATAYDGVNAVLDALDNRPDGEK